MHLNVGIPKLKTSILATLNKLSFFVVHNRADITDCYSFFLLFDISIGK